MLKVYIFFQKKQKNDVCIYKNGVKINVKINNETNGNIVFLEKNGGPMMDSLSLISMKIFDII